MAAKRITERDMDKIYAEAIDAEMIGDRCEDTPAQGRVRTALTNLAVKLAHQDAHLLEEFVAAVGDWSWSDRTGGK